MDCCQLSTGRGTSHHRLQPNGRGPVIECALLPPCSVLPIHLLSVSVWHL